MRISFHLSHSRLNCLIVIIKEGEMETKKFLKLNDIEAYRITFKLSNHIWDVVLKWDFFAKDTIRKHLTI